MLVGQLQQVARGIAGDDPAALQHGDTAAPRLGFFQIMRGQEDGMPFTVEAADEFPQRAAQVDVDPGSRLVEYDDRRLVHQRLGHQQATLHATRQVLRVLVGMLGKIEVMHDLVDPAVVVLETKVAGLDAQGLAHVEEGIVDQFLRHHPERTARLAIVAHNVMAHDGSLAGIGTGESGEDGYQRRLAGAVGPQQAEELAWLDVERHAVQGLGGAETLAQIVDVDGGRRLAHVGSRSDTPYSSANVVKLGGRPVQVSVRFAWRACRMALNMSASAAESTVSSSLISRVSTPRASWGCNSRSRPPTLSTVTAPAMRQHVSSHAITNQSTTPAGARCVRTCRPGS